MRNHLRANLWLLLLTLVLSCLLYPGLLGGTGLFFFRDEADGSLVYGEDGQPIGSRLIAQPFTGPEYFQPRPSAVSYNAAASGASNWSANNYLLRERVARQLGPIVKYRRGPKSGQPVGPDVEAWVQQDHWAGKPGLVAQWAQLHPSVAQSWVKADKLHADHVQRWQNDHPQDVARWITEHSDTPEPKPEDLAVPFFVDYSAKHPGTFPLVVERTSADGKTEKHIEPTRAGTEIQGLFFDLWLQEHPEVELEPVPADMVMASGSGLDPHLTLKSALYQLDRVANQWARLTRRDIVSVRQEIEAILRQRAEAPLFGLVGPPVINVLEVNLALRQHFAAAAPANQRMAVR